MGIKERLKLCYRILTQGQSNFISHAERELLGPEDGNDTIQPLVNRQIKELLLVFSTHWHSESTAQYVRDCFTKLSAFEALTPIKGTDDEWVEVGTNFYQNKRCSRVFKQGNRTYAVDSKIFREPNGHTFTNRASVEDVEFPYTPKQVVIDVEYDDNPIEVATYCQECLEEVMDPTEEVCPRCSGDVYKVYEMK